MTKRYFRTIEEMKRELESHPDVAYVDIITWNDIEAMENINFTNNLEGQKDNAKTRRNRRTSER